MAYDIKFRTRVVEYVQEGHTQEETGKVFKVGTTSIKRWIAVYEATGSTGGGYTSAKRKAKKIDPGELEAYMNEHPDAFLKEIASFFSCCNESVRKALLRNGFRLKKRRTATRNAKRKPDRPILKR